MRFLALAILSVAILSGATCVPSGYVKPTENQKQLNAQNEDAGRQIAAKASEPEVKQAGADVQANSKTLKDTLIGPPEKPAAPYSHEASVQIRTVVVKEYDETKAPWYKRWAGYLLAGVATLLPIALGLGRFFPATAPIAAILTPVASALVGMKQQADAETDDKLHIDKIQTTITTLTKAPIVGPILSNLLAKAHLDQLVHSPEAADPPPSPSA